MKRDQDSKSEIKIQLYFAKCSAELIINIHTKKFYSPGTTPEYVFVRKIMIAYKGATKKMGTE